jgi:hypothetical protein
LQLPDDISDKIVKSPAERALFQEFFDVTIKVGLKQAILHDPVFLKLAFGEDLGYFPADLAGMVEDVPFVELEEGVQLLAQSSMVIEIFRSA